MGQDDPMPERRAVTGAARRALALALVGLCAVLVGLRIALAEPSVWRDGATGLALAGFDPVAFHTHAEPTEGSPAFEHAWGDAVWRFANEGNRQAFARDPAVYAPRFAGFDAFALGSGVAVAGHPLLWVMHEKRVYLFHSEENRVMWALDPARAMQRAKDNWPRIARTLPREPER